MRQNKVFVCDDDRAIVDMLEMILDMTGAVTQVETDSIAAYNKIMSYKPAVLIVDLWMPNVSGDKLIQKIRNTEQIADTYIICISASRDGRQVSIDAGADIFIPKPFDMDEILEKVEFGLSRDSDTISS